MDGSGSRSVSVSGGDGKGCRAELENFGGCRHWTRRRFSPEV